MPLNPTADRTGLSMQQTPKSGVLKAKCGGGTSAIPELWQWRQEDQKFKLSFGYITYIVSLEPAWVTGDSG